MKRDARLPFVVNTNEKISDGLSVIKTFAESLQDTPVDMHLAGHSTGAVLLGHLLGALDVLERPDLIKSCSLMAPACTMDFYKEHYAPRLGNKAVDAGVRLSAMDVYNLTDTLELDDNVAYVYRKSLLFLVSRALERQMDKPILGMQRYSKKIASMPGLKIHYSDGKKGSVTRSTSHGGFDNDHRTLNSIMKRVLGQTPQYPFRKSEMEGY